MLARLEMKLKCEEELNYQMSSLVAVASIYTTFGI